MLRNVGEFMSVFSMASPDTLHDTGVKCDSSESTDRLIQLCSCGPRDFRHDSTRHSFECFGASAALNSLNVVV